MPEAKSEHKNAAAFPTSSILTFLLSAELSAAWSSNFPKPLMPLAAHVFIAPADTALTRIPFSAPKAAAIYLTLASREAFATPITL